VKEIRELLKANEISRSKEIKEVANVEVNEASELPRCPCDESCENLRSVKPAGMVADMWEDIIIVFATVDGFTAARYQFHQNFT